VRDILFTILDAANAVSDSAEKSVRPAGHRAIESTANEVRTKWD
jgi:hypothetical protein